MTEHFLREPLTLSVIIPCYNYARYLPDCLGSIFSQVDPPDFEVIAVDDGSTDDTARVLAEFDDPRLRVVIRRENRGHVATITECLSLARGAIIARIDPDDRYRSHFMRTVCTALAAHQDAGLVYGVAALMDDAGRVTYEGPTSRREPVVRQELVRLLERNFICAPTVAARREVWMEALPVPPHVTCDDWYFTLRAAQRQPFCVVDDVLADYRVHAANYHTMSSRNRQEEQSVIWLLDKIFGETERNPALEAAKRAARARVYASHYLDFAEKYFGFGMDADARRCYVKAARYRPAHLASLGVVRRALASMTSRRGYERVKLAWKRVR